jgi:hypothetical protein
MPLDLFVMANSITSRPVLDLQTVRHWTQSDQETELKFASTHTWMASQTTSAFKIVAKQHEFDLNDLALCS